MIDLRVKEQGKKIDNQVDLVTDGLKRFEQNIEKTLPALYRKYKIEVDHCMQEQIRSKEELNHRFTLLKDTTNKIHETIHHNKMDTERLHFAQSE